MTRSNTTPTPDLQPTPLTPGHDGAPHGSVERQKVHFPSGDTTCAAWHYRGTNGACVIMMGGLAVTKEPATDAFAQRFHDAGFSVLAFEYRGIGESGGQPRQVQRMGEMLADWRTAIEFAAGLPEVDAARIAIWAFSLSGGHVFRTAARNPAVAAAIAHAPLVDGPRTTLAAGRHTTQLAMLRLTGRGLLDALGGIVGRKPRLVPLVGPAGTVAMLSTPDAFDGDQALNPDNKHPDWQQEVAARSAVRVTVYRPGRHASRIECPLLVLVYDHDHTAPPDLATRAAERAPRGELVRRPGGHYKGFLDGHDEAIDIHLSFLRRHLLNGSPDA